MHALLELFWQVFAALVAIVAPWFAHRIIALFEQKTKIRLSAETEARLAGWIEKGIGYAEEKAHQASLNGVGKLSGDQKLDAACNYVAQAAQRFGLVKLAEDEIAQLVEARLGVQRTTVTPTKVTP